MWKRHRGVLGASMAAVGPLGTVTPGARAQSCYRIVATDNPSLGLVMVEISSIHFRSRAVPRSTRAQCQGDLEPREEALPAISLARFKRKAGAVKGCCR